MAARNWWATAPKGWLTISDLVARWDGVFHEETIRRWLRKPRGGGKPKVAGKQLEDGRYVVSESEAERVEREHPRLRARGGAA